MSALLIALLVLVILAVGLALLSARQARAVGRAAEAAAPPIGRFLTVEHPAGPLKLHYVERGPQDPEAAAGRPTVVMLHGLGGNLRHFTATILDDLARDHRVIAFDRPGMGFSDRSKAGDADLEEQARILGLGLEALGVEKPLLIGHSLGGALSLTMALRRPVAGLLLLAPATFPFKAPADFAKTIDAPWLRRLIARTIGPSLVKAARPKVMEIVFGPQPEPPEFAVAGGGMLTLRPPQIETTMADASMLMDALKAQSLRYGEIDAPITVVYGDADRLLSAEDHVPPLQAAAPQTKVRMAHGVGHMVPFAAPEIALAAAREMTGAPHPD